MKILTRLNPEQLLLFRYLKSLIYNSVAELRIDNGAKVGMPGDKKNGGDYTKVDWWNPWLMVWD